MFGYSLPTEQWKRDVLVSRSLLVATAACVVGFFLASGRVSTVLAVGAPVSFVSALWFGTRAQRGYHAEKGTFPDAGAETGGDD